MSFLKPMMLLGVLGALVPIIIHLIHKRRPRKQEFAAIEFVIRSVQRVQRRWRLRRFLLLAARVLIIAALALAAARPLLGTNAGDLVETSGPQRIVLVIDASLSMRGRKPGGQTGFEVAISKAKSIIEGLGAEDQMTILIADREPELLLENLTNSKPELFRVLSAAQSGFAHVDLANAVGVAGQILTLANTKDGSAKAVTDKAKETESRIVILSDLAAHSFQQASALEGSIKLSVIDVFEDVPTSERKNYGITKLDVQVVPSTNVNTVQARARIRSFLSKKGESDGPSAKDINLIGPEGVAVEASVNIIEGNQTEKSLEHAFSGTEKFVVSVQVEDDFLVEDNERYAPVNVQARIRSLIVDGAPSGLPKEDEIFYLERALAAGAKDQPLPKIIIADDLAKEDLSKYKVLILAGVTSIGAKDGEKITAFVQGGGGLLITASENMDIDQYNAVLGRVLPRPLRGLKRKEALSKRSKSDDSALLFEVDAQHPVMSVFTGEALQGLKTTRTQAYYLLQRNKNREANVIMAYEDGQPALIETQIARGRVVLLTTSIDRDLSDLPIRPAFVPLMRQLVLFLGNALARPDDRVTLVEDTRELYIPRGSTDVEVETPSGERISLSSRFDDELVSFQRTSEPGFYRVYVRRSGKEENLVDENFVVNVDARESNIQSLLPSEAVAILRGESAPSDAKGKEQEKFAFKVGGLSNPDQLAHGLLILMLLAFLGESLLTAQWSRKSTDSAPPQSQRKWYRRIFRT